MLDRKEGADQVDAEDLLPILRALLEDRGEAAGDAGIGEEDVEPAMLADRKPRPGRCTSASRPGIGGDDRLRRR
jgi:hypothetical protein